jgi:hypothetical protein
MYNTFWPRFVALILDGIILSVVDEVFKLIPKSDSKTLVFLYSAVEKNIPYIYTMDGWPVWPDTRKDGLVYKDRGSCDGRKDRILPVVLAGGYTHGAG